MIVKLLTEHHLEFLSLKGGCRGSSESILVKMPHCGKSRGMAQIMYDSVRTTKSCHRVKYGIFHANYKLRISIINESISFSSILAIIFIIQLQTLMGLYPLVPN